jgi:hypothetical protein
MNGEENEIGNRRERRKEESRELGGLRKIGDE